jgi:hypothetical protein
MAEAGTIRKIDISGRQKRFDFESEEHNHIHCIRCQRVDNIQLDHGNHAPMQPVDNRGYTIGGSRIEFFGYCPDCQEEIQEKGDTEMGGDACRTTSLSDSQRKILVTMAGNGGTYSSKDLAAASGMEAKQVSCQLAALKKKGFISSPVRCKYEITPQGKKALQ